MKYLYSAFFIMLTLTGASALYAQSAGEQGDYLTYSWKKVATQMPATWYASADAEKVAATVLYCQLDAGGWAKNKPYHHPMTAEDSSSVRENRSGIGATIDNGATTTEMIFLANIYAATGEGRYFTAFEKGIYYLLSSQYPNGGFPQFYPFRKGNSVSYASHITYNDNAMVNVLRLFRKIIDGDSLYARMPLSGKVRERIRKAWDKGVDCILQTQIRVKGQLTVWCAQHDEVSLLPANARAYELASFSGQESIGIIQLLMDIPQPSERIIHSVKGAMQWMDEHKITGWRLENKPGADGKKNMILIPDPAAPVLLARFYDLDTGKPFFCDRDGIKKNSLAEIGPERRNGYSWYTTGFESLQKQYTNWKLRWNIK